MKLHAASRELLEFAYARALETHELTAPNLLGLAEIRLRAGKVQEGTALLRRLALVVGEPNENLDAAAALLEKTGHGCAATSRSRTESHRHRGPSFQAAPPLIQIFIRLTNNQREPPQQRGSSQIFRAQTNLSQPQGRAVNSCVSSARAYANSSNSHTRERLRRMN